MALSKGCTIGLIVVGVIVVIIIIGIIVVMMNADKIKNAGIDVMIKSATESINKNIPEGYTEDSVQKIMDELKAKLKNGNLGPKDIQELANTFQAAMADKQMDREEAEHLLKLIQKKLGQEVPEEVEELPDSLEAVPDSI